MSSKHLKPNPHLVNEHFWWFEETRGICVCTENFSNGEGRKVDVNYIPWNSIRAALKRKDKK